MRDYQKLIKLLKQSRESLYELITVDNASQISRVTTDLAKVEGTIEAWDIYQEQEIDALASEGVPR